MNDNRSQDLTEIVASIIKMMLSAIRARGLRGLIDLPNMIMAALYLRRLGREFAALMAAFKAGTLHPPAPEPAPAPALWIPPQDPQAANVQPPAAPRPAGRRDPAKNRRRQRIHVPTAVPAEAAGPDRPRAHAMPQPPMPAPCPEPLAVGPAAVSKKLSAQHAPLHALFVTISEQKSAMHHCVDQHDPSRPLSQPRVCRARPRCYTHPTP
jgi:hypothetical protein